MIPSSGEEEEGGGGGRCKWQWGLNRVLPGKL